MTAPRRVRTQAERAGDDHTWRGPEPDIHYGPPIRPPHLGPPPLITEREPAPPRWWHRLTRRNP